MVGDDAMEYVPLEAFGSIIFVVESRLLSHDVTQSKAYLSV